MSNYSGAFSAINLSSFLHKLQLLTQLFLNSACDEGSPGSQLPQGLCSLVVAMNSEEWDSEKVEEKSLPLLRC